MKTTIATFVMALTAASPAWAHVCLPSRDVESATSKDGKLMTFKMRDGRVLVNHLQGICSDLRYEGFVWELPGTGDVCENQQSLRVLRSGQSCLLGRFELIKDKPSKNKPAVNKP